MTNLSEIDLAPKISTHSNYLKDLSPDNPYRKICCTTRKITPTVCNWTCNGCKRQRELFNQTEPLRLRTNDVIFQWGDPEEESQLADIDTYRAKLQEKIKIWEQRKIDIVKKLREELCLREQYESNM